MRVAFITAHEILGPSNAGNIQASKRNLYLLQSIFGSKNVFVCVITRDRSFLSQTTSNMTLFFSNRNKNDYTFKNIIGALCGRVHFGKKTEKLVLKHVLQLNCDMIFFDRSLMGFLPNKLPKRIKQILFLHNIEVDRLWCQFRKVSNWFLILPVRIAESVAVKNADVIITLNNRDATALKKWYGRDSDLRLPITFHDSFAFSKIGKNFVTDLTMPLQLLFVGSYFWANVIGITWFVDFVLPHVNAVLTVAGRGMDKLTQKLARNNVKVVGTVVDLSEYYYRADAVVSPILSGGGMKVKTAEALMYGKPMFATDEALEGYEVEGQKNIFRCNTPQEFISAINTYKGIFTSRFDADIRQLFLKKYHTPVYMPVLRKLLT